MSLRAHKSKINTKDKYRKGWWLGRWGRKYEYFMYLSKVAGRYIGLKDSAKGCYAVIFIITEWQLRALFIRKLIHKAPKISPN